MNHVPTDIAPNQLAPCRVTAAIRPAAPPPHGRAAASVVRRRDERGEGVISTAIAVLIVALLGVALWTGFSAMVKGATDRTADQLEQIGG